MRFEFATAGKIVFGSGTRQEIGKIASAYGRTCMLVHGRREEPVQEILDNIKSGGLQVYSFPVHGEPDLDLIRTLCVETRSDHCDVVIAVGGGSTLDAGKAAAGLAPQEGDVLDYLEVIGTGKSLNKPPLPFIAIPTTAGTGSEVTKNAVISSPEHRLKASLRSPLIIPKVALIDPELMVSMPPEVTAATGMDAFTQLVEPFVCKKANPFSDACCRQGLKHLGENLRTAYNDGYNLPAREGMALAAMFSGLALANSGLGAAHGLAGPLGGLLNAPHGALCARLIGPVSEVNIKILTQTDSNHPVLNRYTEIGEILGCSPMKNTSGILDWIMEIVESMGIPRLRDHGLERGMFPEVIAQSKRTSSMQATPASLDDSDIKRILDLAY